VIFSSKWWGVSSKLPVMGRGYGPNMGVLMFALIVWREQFGKATVSLRVVIY
jgi:hypothetical protein